MMRNITFSADDVLIKKARLQAEHEHYSLNVVFREWLKQYVRQKDYSSNYKNLMSQLKYARAGRKFSRDDLNER